LKFLRWLAIAAITPLIGCFHYEEPLSSHFNNIEYQLTAFRDSLFLSVSSSASLSLNYRIRGLSGRMNQGGDLHFVMPMTDTVTITWINGSGQTMVVPLRMNKKIFDSLPEGNDSTAIIIHPGDVPINYSIRIEWIVPGVPESNLIPCLFPGKNLFHRPHQIADWE